MVNPVGRNKLVRATAKTGVSGKPLPDQPETPTLRYAWMVLFRPTCW
ncbi:MAG: hypothetical protein WC762_02665 [Methylobacter sp.]